MPTCVLYVFSHFALLFFAQLENVIIFTVLCCFAELNRTGDVSDDLLDYLMKFLIDANTLYSTADRENLHVGKQIFHRSLFPYHDHYMGLLSCSSYRARPLCDGWW